MTVTMLMIMMVRKKMKDENGEEPLPEKEVQEKKSVAPKKMASQEKVTESADSDLSSFTQWLKSLKQPDVNRSELTDPTPAVPAAKDETPIVAPKKAESEETPEVQHQKTRTLPDGEQILDAAKVKKANKKKKKKKKRKQQADDGDPIILSDEVYSETLAELLESQGHTTEAIAMYEKLRLKYPEKSRFFAAKIEKLHKKA